MKNRVLSVVAGLLISWLLVGIGDGIVARLFPFPDHLDPHNEDQLNEFINTLPIMAFWLMLSFWSLAAFSGGFITASLAASKWQRLTIITGVILTLGSYGNLVILKHPLWVSISAMIVYPVMIIIGSLIGHWFRTFIKR